MASAGELYERASRQSEHSLADLEGNRLFPSSAIEAAVSSLSKDRIVQVSFSACVDELGVGIDADAISEAASAFVP